jgi:hypothetical protein
VEAVGCFDRYSAPSWTGLTEAADALPDLPPAQATSDAPGTRGESSSATMLHGAGRSSSTPPMPPQQMRSRSGSRSRSPGGSRDAERDLVRRSDRSHRPGPRRPLYGLRAAPTHRATRPETSPTGRSRIHLHRRRMHLEPSPPNPSSHPLGPGRRNQPG